MDIDLTQFDKEIQAGYITPDYKVYSNVPNYIKEMAIEINKDYQKFYHTDFFTFIDEECLTEAEDLPPLPDFIKNARKELEKEYTKL